MRLRPALVAAAAVATLASSNRAPAQTQSGSATPTPTHPAPNHDPDAAQIVTSDLANFWRAYDAAQHAPDSAARVAAYRDLYIRKGTPGLRNWTDERLTVGDSVRGRLVATGRWTLESISAAQHAPDSTPEHRRLDHDARPFLDDVAAMVLDYTIQKRPRFYAAIRGNTLALDTARAFKDSVHARFARIAALYPDAIFPPVYLEIGRLSSGGTTGESGMLIGAEMHGADPSTPRDELSPWERSVVDDASTLPALVTHELVHVEQSFARHGVDRTDSRSLLARALDEGCATFVASLAGTPGADSSGIDAYGLAHEHDLWVEFQREMLGTDYSHWLYQGDRSKDRPADLGYFVGARICRAYYLNASDKNAAIRDILVMRDPVAFEKASGYAP